MYVHECIGGIRYMYICGVLALISPVVRVNRWHFKMHFELYSLSYLHFHGKSVEM